MMGGTHPRHVLNIRRGPRHDGPVRLCRDPFWGFCVPATAPLGASLRGEGARGCARTSDWAWIRGVAGPGQVVC